MNRAYFLSASSNGYATNDMEELALGFPQKTLMTQLEEVGKDWGVFFELFPTSFFMRELRSRPENFHMLSDFQGNPDSSFLFLFLFPSPPSHPPFLPSLLHSAIHSKLLIPTIISELCASGKLPTFSYLEPRYFSVTEKFPANDQHPSHDVEEGLLLAYLLT